MKKAYIYFEDMTLFKGFFFVKNKEPITLGELVFNTSSSGYEESLTDPSYTGQFLLFTFPQIGIYKLNKENFEGNEIYPKTIFAKNFNQSNQEFKNKLAQNNVNAIQINEIRQLTLKIRNEGCLKTIVSNKKLSKLQIKKIFKEKSISFFPDSPIKFENNNIKNDLHLKNILLVNFGCKKGINQQLNKYENINIINIDQKEFSNFFKKNKNQIKETYSGVIFSNGPGDPTQYANIINEVRLIMNLIPSFGICLGHQIMAMAQGCEIIKLKFGHHGINHPVINQNNKIFITSQNHNFAVKEESISKHIKITFKHVNDNSIAGLKYHSLASSVQFHPEANPGPSDTQFLFKDFIKTIDLFNKEKKLCGHISTKTKKSLYWAQVPLLSGKVPNLIMQEYSV